MVLIFAGCVNQDPVKKAENLLKKGKTTTVQTPTGHSFEVPVGRYKPTGSYRLNDSYNAGNIQMYSVTGETDVIFYCKKFEKEYCSSSSYSKKTKKEKKTLSKLSNSVADITIINFVINGHFRTVTEIYVPDIGLLAILSPYGTNSSHKDIVELFLKTLS